MTETVGKAQDGGDRAPLVDRPQHPQEQAQRGGCGMRVIVNGEIPGVHHQRIAANGQQQCHPAQALQRLPDAGHWRDQHSDQEDRQVLRVVVLIVEQPMGLLEASHQQQTRQRQERHRYQQHPPAPNGPRGPCAYPHHRVGRRQAPKEPGHQRVSPQVRQEPQMVPGRQAQTVAVGATESLVGAQILCIKRQVALLVAAGSLFHHLIIGLWRHDHGHAEQQRQQQLARSSI